jgi:hypothetical protein
MLKALLLSLLLKLHQLQLQPRKSQSQSLSVSLLESERLLLVAISFPWLKSIRRACRGLQRNSLLISL